MPGTSSTLYSVGEKGPSSRKGEAAGPASSGGRRRKGRLAVQGEMHAHPVFPGGDVEGQPVVPGPKTGGDMQMGAGGRP